MALTDRHHGRTFARAAAVVFALALGAGASAAERTVEVLFPAEAVTGLPLPVRLVVHGEAEVSPARLMGRANPYPFTLTSDELTYEFPARRYFVHRPPRRNYHVPGPGKFKLPLRVVQIKSEESSEFVFDLSLLDGGAVAGDAKNGNAKNGRVMPGEYTVEMTDPDLRFEYARASIRFVEPNAEERYLLRNLARMKSDKPGWQVFVEQSERAMRGVDPKRFSEFGRRQMSFLMLLAKLVRSKAPIGEISIREEDTAGLLSGYRTEGLILRYEIETARDDDDGAKATRATIVAARPNAGELLDYIAERGGMIAHYRKAAATHSRARRATEGAASDLPRKDVAR